MHFPPAQRWDSKPKTIKNPNKWGILFTLCLQEAQWHDKIATYKAAVVEINVRLPSHERINNTTKQVEDIINSMERKRWYYRISWMYFIRIFASFLFVQVKSVRFFKINLLFLLWTACAGRLLLFIKFIFSF